MDPVRFAFGYIITPSCSVAGVITNTFNIVVFYADGLRQGNNVTLFTLSVVDCLVSLYSTFAFGDFYFEGRSSKEMFVFQRGVQNGYTPLYGLKQASLLLTAKIVVGRYIVVKWPFLIRRLEFGIKLSVLTDTFLIMIGMSSIIWNLAFIGEVIVNPAKNYTEYYNSTDSDGNFTVRAVHSFQKESYGINDEYKGLDIIAWFYVNNALRAITLIFVSVCGADMVVELRKHSASLFKTAENDAEESVSVSAVASSSSSIRRNDTQPVMPNFLSVAQNRANRVALGTAVLFMVNMSVSMAQFTTSFYCNFLVEDCHAEMYALAVNPLYLLNQLHGFGFSLIYSFSFLIYYKFNRRFKMKFLAIFCGCCHVAPNSQSKR